MNALLWLTLALAPCGDGAAVAPPLACAHAHNDYEHARPLWDALDQGFCSVEADIFLVDGQLLVGHTKRQLRPERTLQSLYLRPLRDRAMANGGRIHKDGPEFSLLVDIKTEAAPTFAALAKALTEYADILTISHKDQLEIRAVRVVISGNRAMEAIAAWEPRLAGIDGRAEHLGTDMDATVMPWISENWSKHFAWRGQGPLTEADRIKLADFVERAHRRGRRVRFWGAPDSALSWQVQWDARVDLINTDRLADFAAWRRHGAQRAP